MSERTTSAVDDAFDRRRRAFVASRDVALAGLRKVSVSHRAAGAGRSP
ncbi:MAG: hypothetical protein LC777_14075 [Actinobacteria bacterium]|nr:hypothetical protein [Actinomycetota bacterium]